MYLEHLDASNLYGWGMSQKFFNGKKSTSKFNEDFIKNYDEDSNNEYIIEVDVEYPKELLFNEYKYLRYLPERMKIKLNGPEKPVCNIHNKKNYVVHIRVLKQALNHRLILKKVHRVIQLNQEEWLKPYIEMNTNLRTTAKNDFEKDFFKLINNSVFEKMVENARKNRNVKLVTTNKRRIRLVSEPNYHTTKWFSEDLLAMEIKKIKVKMNKPVLLGLSMFDISKMLMCEL